MTRPCSTVPHLRVPWCAFGLLALGLAGLPAAEPPPTVVQTVPSPATATGERIWDPPAFTHWPAIIYRDEARNVALGLPVRQAGTAGSLGWADGPALPFTLPDQADRIGALLDLPVPGANPERRLTARVVVPDVAVDLPLRLASTTAAWPLAGLRDGFPVDAEGVPVVLVDYRPDPAEARRWQVVRTPPPRPIGRALIVGDPMSAMGGSPWDGLDAETRPAVHARYPHHAALVALASLPMPLPATVVWCPGNEGTAEGVWSDDEGRLMGALTHRLAALGQRPRLVLALPPQPVAARAARIQPERRRALVHDAVTFGWEVIDLAAAAVDPASGNRVADGVLAAYPVGEARARVRAALAAALAR